MKIIGGKYKSKQLVTPEGAQTRPTLNRIKENVFNILDHRFDVAFEGKKVLDLFAGSGALGIECYSRGADLVTFIDNEETAIKAIKKNTKSFDAQQIKIYQESVLKFLKKKSDEYDLVFIDPPYDINIIEPTLKTLYENNWIHENGLIIVEATKGYAFQCPNQFEVLDTRTYAKTTLFFVRWKSGI